MRPIGSIHSDIRYSDKNKRMFKDLVPVFLQLNSVFKDRPFTVEHSVGLPQCGKSESI